MIFNDYIEILNKQKDEVVRLNEIKESFESISSKYIEWSQQMFSNIYARRISTNNTNFGVKANELVEITEKYGKDLREELIGIDFIDLGEILSNINLLANDEISNISNKLGIELRSIYGRIHKYRRYSDKQNQINEFSECIEDIRNAVFYIDEFLFMVDSMNIINTGLNKGIEEEGLEIKLLNSSFEQKTYGLVTDPVYKLYEKIAEIGNININDEKLEIVRMETGSFFIKFFGNKSILKLIASIVESVHKILIRGYTREGKKQNLAESTELFKSQFDIVKEMKELGMDVNEHEEIAKETLALLMKQSSILLSSSPDIKINKRVLSKSEEMKKALEATSYKTLPFVDEDIVS